MVSSLSWNDLWELLKATIEQLYMSEKKKLSEVVTTMKRDHRFDAVESQYKYHFKKWNWKENLPRKEAAAVAAELQTRALIGKGFTSVTYQGRPVDVKRIRRHLKESVRQSRGVQLKFPSGIFLKWNMPYAAMQGFHSSSPNRSPVLPFPVPSPLSDIEIATLPVLAPSSQTARSPTMTLVKTKTAMDRARLFFEGRYDQLITSMNKTERSTMSQWLYQYWYYGFKTAKEWGRGPRNLTAASLQFGDLGPYASHSLPATLGGTANNGLSPHPEDVTKPSDLCHWHIHEPWPEEDDGESSTDSSVTTPDSSDETTWKDWPTAWQDPPLDTRLRNALEHNDFSTILAGNLPVAVPKIAAAAKRSLNELLEESLGFAIMGRNHDLVEEISYNIIRVGADVNSLYPFHLAVAYLDGSMSCCNILRRLLQYFYKPSFFTNDLGHTLLDSLMITILKSHTSIKAHKLDDSLRHLNRFPGEEVDICGRWDADSDCIRQLYASGTPSVPPQWKHKFLKN